MARALPFLRCLRQMRTGAEAVFDWVKHAGDRGALVQHGEQKIGPPLVANTGLGRRKGDAVDRRQADERCRRKRRNA